MYFYHEGGVDIGDVDSKAETVDVDIASTLTEEQANSLVSKVPEDKKRYPLGQYRKIRLMFLNCMCLVVF